MVSRLVMISLAAIAVAGTLAITMSAQAHPGTTRRSLRTCCRTGAAPPLARPNRHEISPFQAGRTVPPAGAVGTLF